MSLKCTFSHLQLHWKDRMFSISDHATGQCHKEQSAKPSEGVSMILSEGIWHKCAYLFNFSPK